MKIGGLQKSSLIDFPGKIAAIIFTQGCNFRCGYCHNPELLSAVSNLSLGGESVLNFLESRRGLLDGVVISGGEPTLQEDLSDFLQKIKSLGFGIKLDTNGTSPDVIQALLSKNLIDYIAMDIKAPLEKYPEITCTKIDIKKIRKSIEITMNSGLEYEFRTTVLKSQLSTDDFDAIGELLCGAKKYYLQQFVQSKILDETLRIETYTDEELQKIAQNLQKQIENVGVR